MDGVSRTQTLHLFSLSDNEENEEGVVALDHTPIAGFQGRKVAVVIDPSTPLGHGATKTVRAATAITPGGTEHPKALHINRDSNETYREAALLGQIHDDNPTAHLFIIGAPEAQATRGRRIYATQELMNGGDLTRLPHISRERFFAMAFRIAAGLSIVHKTHIHCDLKPHNIFWNDQGQTKLGDFGHAQEKAVYTTLIGTPGWIAPDGKISTKSDIWALGKVLRWLWDEKVGSRAPVRLKELLDQMQHNDADARPQAYQVAFQLLKQVPKGRPVEGDLDPAKMVQLEGELNIAHRAGYLYGPIARCDIVTDALGNYHLCRWDQAARSHKIATNGMRIPLGVERTPKEDLQDLHNFIQASIAQPDGDGDA